METVIGDWDLSDSRHPRNRSFLGIVVATVFVTLTPALLALIAYHATGADRSMQPVYLAASAIATIWGLSIVLAFWLGREMGLNRRSDKS